MVNTYTAFAGNIKNGWTMTSIMPFCGSSRALSELFMFIEIYWKIMPCLLSSFWKTLRRPYKECHECLLGMSFVHTSLSYI